MSFFKNIFNSNSTSEPSATGKNFWKKIETSEDLHQAILESNEKKVVIFKHSTRCHISKTVLSQFEREVQQSDKEFSYYFLDLIAHRALSNEIAEKFGVTHQSPQLLVIDHEKVMHHSSHSAISLENI